MHYSTFDDFDTQVQSDERIPDGYGDDDLFDDCSCDSYGCYDYDDDLPF